MRYFCVAGTFGTPALPVVGVSGTGGLWGMKAPGFPTLSIACQC